MGIDAAQAAKEATSSIPIVFVFGVDPIKFGFVRSLNRPGGNVTGMSLYTSELHAKRVDLLNEFIRAATPIGMIINPKMPDTDSQVKSAEAAAGATRHPLVVVKASNETELDKAFASMSESHVAAILAVSDNFLYSRRDQIISLASRYSIPMMYPFREDATAGGLLSYGTNVEDVYRQAGIYVARILEGEKPGVLPIQQPTRFDLVINLKTAKALGLDFPATLLARADEVIE
jgi:putative ABC transport system substrate-binding protein